MSQPTNPGDVFDLVYRFDLANPFERPSPGDVSAALGMLLAGNREVASMADAVAGGPGCGRQWVVMCDPRDLGLTEVPGQALRQEPFALVVGCSDARVPVEMIFNRASNELFVVRVAGNVLGDECLGSIDYALAHFAESLKLVVLLGHTGCGAVTAAVDTYLSPGLHAEIAHTRSLRSILNHLMLPVRVGAMSLVRAWGEEVRRRPGYRESLIEVAVCLNVAMAAYNLKRELSTSEQPGVEVVYGVYDLLRHRVRVPSGDEQDAVRLLPAPSDLKDLNPVVLELARNRTVRRLLGEPE
jgi:carbonic anhydrase